jgi:hypothetical protein
MAWKINNGTKHNDTCTMAFGNKSIHSNCPRCEELKTGAVARNWGNINNRSTIVDLRDRYCFKLAPWQSTCNMQTNPSCNCGKSAYTD